MSEKGGKPHLGLGPADETLKDIGEGTTSIRGLAYSEDKRILRRIDLW